MNAFRLPKEKTIDVVTDKRHAQHFNEIIQIVCVASIVFFSLFEFNRHIWFQATYIFLSAAQIYMRIGRYFLSVLYSI